MATTISRENMTHLYDFETFGRKYSHWIDVQDTDGVYLFCETSGNALIEYTANSDVYQLGFDQNRRELLGRFRLIGNRWVMTNKDDQHILTGSSIDDPDGLLKDEVEYSKIWLRKQQEKFLESESMIQQFGLMQGFKKPKVRIPHPDDEKNLTAAQAKRARKAARNLANSKK